MLTAASQVLLRNADYFEKGKWALVNPYDAAIFTHLDSADLIGLHQYHDQYSAALQTNRTQYFAAAFELDSLLDGAVIYLPKAKQQLDMLIANMRYLIKPGGQLMIVGENKAGIKSVDKLLQKHFQQVNKLDSAKHCALICGELAKPAEGKFDISHYVVERSYQVNHESLVICSLPGVFGHKQFDPGTQQLLAEFHASADALVKLRGAVLDFACGTGIIGAYLAKANPKINVVCSDVSALAIYCSERTFARNQVNGEFIASNGLQEVDMSFNAIITNPPFHTGIYTDYDITREFIKVAHQQTKKYGRLHLVANRFLPYLDVLEAHYYKVNIMAQTNKYIVYEAIK